MLFAIRMGQPCSSCTAGIHDLSLRLKQSLTHFPLIVSLTILPKIIPFQSWRCKSTRTASGFFRDPIFGHVFGSQSSCCCVSTPTAYVAAQVSTIYGSTFSGTDRSDGVTKLFKGPLKVIEPPPLGFQLTVTLHCIFIFHVILKAYYSKMLNTCSTTGRLLVVNERTHITNKPSQSWGQ